MDSDDLPGDMLSNDYLTFKADTSTDDVLRMLDESGREIAIVLNESDEPVKVVVPSGEVDFITVQNGADLSRLISDADELERMANDLLKALVTDVEGQIQGVVQSEWIQELSWSRKNVVGMADTASSETEDTQLHGTIGRQYGKHFPPAAPKDPPSQEQEREGDKSDQNKEK